ncbi:ABC transporter permease subunit [Kocuria sediminis]|uniref:ABC transporter permease subunit n=1 Tax=Kocuria sediminis TaxID=1038857 RepID=A0A6N8GIK8_9MICC|nr:ABC transporter permease subunit [Kocuria sediminis]MUN62921.1 ABC transporter permease subunit [Kocuria sediminis]
MSTSTSTAPRPETTTPGPTGHAGPAFDARLGFGRVLRSEWIKFRSLRSHWILLAVALLLSLGFAALSASSTLTFIDINEQAAQQQVDDMLDGRSPEEIGLTEEQVQQQRDEFLAQSEQQMAEGSGLSLPDGMGFGEYMAMSSANGGLQLVMLLLGALAVLFIGSEYATRSIQTTMTAVPRRTPVMLAKVAVLSVVTFLFGLISAVLCHLLVQPILAGGDLGYDLWQEPILLNILAVGLFYMITAWLGFGLGALLKSTTWGIVVLVVLLLVLEIVLFALSFEWLEDAKPYSPAAAGAQLTAVYQPSDAVLNHVESGLVYGAWGLLFVLAGILVTKKRAL